MNHLTRAACSSLAAASRIFCRLPPPPPPQPTTRQFGNNITVPMPCRRLLSTASFSDDVGEASGGGSGASLKTRQATNISSGGFGLQKKFGFRGGDYNNITLVGTVTKISEKTSVKAAISKPYVVVRVQTLFRYRDSASKQFVCQNSLHTVVAFSLFTRNIARNLKVGDRVFVSGRMEYYIANGSRATSIQAERIIPMAGAGDGTDDAVQQQDSELAEEDESSGHEDSV